MSATRIYVPGDLVGPYTISGLIGHGGGGSVYQGVHEDGPVHAVKVSSYNLRELSRPQRDHITQRLEREFSLLKLFPHPYIVPVHTFGFCVEEGTPYIGMELLIGKTLDIYLREDESGLRTRVELFRKLLEAVAHLHAHGVVHRDIKPSNIWVRSNGDPVLFDLGIVSAPWMDTITHEQKVLGTPQFMSPESFLHSGRGHYRPKPTDDVYSLGVVFYLMLTGKLPHDSPAQRLLRSSEPDHPSTLAPRTPRILGDLAMRMLAKNPTRRIQDAQAALDELISRMVAVPLAPAPDLATEALPIPATATRDRRSRQLGITFATAVVLTLVALGVLRWSRQPGDTLPTPPPPGPSCEAQSPGWMAASRSLHEQLQASIVPTGPDALLPSSSPIPQSTKKARVSVRSTNLHPTSNSPRRPAWTALLCTLAAGHISCASVPVRTDEEFLDKCAPGAKATTEQLGLSPNKYYKARMLQWLGKDRRRATPLFIKEGPVVAVIDVRDDEFDRERSKLEGARLYGHAHPLSDRVSLQYSKIQLRDGTELPICATAYTWDAPEFGSGVQRWPDPGQVQPSREELEESLKELQAGEIPISWDLHFFKVR